MIFPSVAFGGADMHETKSPRSLDPATVLAEHDGLIKSVVAQYLPRHLRGYRADVEQTARLHLWEKSLPRFDPSRGASVATFLYVCVRQVVFGAIKRINRDAIESIESLGEEDFPAVADSDNFDIEVLEADVMSRLRTILTPHQYRLFWLLRQGYEPPEIARMMGIALVTVYRSTHKIRTRIGQVAP